MARGAAARLPWATLGVGATLGAVYLAGLWLQRDEPASLLASLRPGTLIALGALRLPLPWPPPPGSLLRLVTASLVHVDPQHLATNLAVLVALGAWPGRLERLCGAARVLGLLALGGLAGSLAAALGYRDGPTLVAGASGALLALATAAALSPGAPRQARGEREPVSLPLLLRLGAAATALGLLLAGALLGDRGAGAAHLGGCALGLGFRAWARPRFR